MTGPRGFAIPPVPSLSHCSTLGCPEDCHHDPLPGSTTVQSPVVGDPPQVPSEPGVAVKPHQSQAGLVGILRAELRGLRARAGSSSGGWQGHGAPP